MLLELLYEFLCVVDFWMQISVRFTPNWEEILTWHGASGITNQNPVNIEDGDHHNQEVLSDEVFFGFVCVSGLFVGRVSSKPVHESSQHQVCLWLTGPTSSQQHDGLQVLWTNRFTFLLSWIGLVIVYPSTQQWDGQQLPVEHAVWARGYNPLWDAAACPHPFESVMRSCDV